MKKSGRMLVIKKQIFGYTRNQRFITVRYFFAKKATKGGQYPKLGFRVYSHSATNNRPLLTQKRLSNVHLIIIDFPLYYIPIISVELLLDPIVASLDLGADL